MICYNNYAIAEIPSEFQVASAIRTKHAVSSIRQSCWTSILASQNMMRMLWLAASDASSTRTLQEPREKNTKKQ